MILYGFAFLSDIAFGGLRMSVSQGRKIVS